MIYIKGEQDAWYPFIGGAPIAKALIRMYGNVSDTNADYKVESISFHPGDGVIPAPKQDQLVIPLTSLILRD